MRKRRRFWDKLGRKVYEKPKWNKKILTIRRSFDEVCGLLNGKKK